MAAFSLKVFGGMSSKVAPRLLPEEMATLAENVDFSRGTFRPLRASDSASPTINLGAIDGATRTIYKTTEGKWLEFSADVNVIDSPIAEDSHERVYITGNTSYPQIASAQSLGNIYKLGIPAPPTPSVALDPATSENESTETPITRGYVATYVTAFGEEGPPSSITTSDLVNVYTDQEVDVTVGSATGTRNYAYIRIYRTDEDGVFRFIQQVSSSGATFTDIQTPDTSLGEEVPSTDWIGPPDDMLGIVSIPNGICAGFVDQTLCLSEAYLPHAWPEAYQLTAKYKIVGLAPLDSGLLVLTEGKPFVVQGADPSAMVMTELDISQACVSKRSIVDMGNYVMYASPDGLVRISSSGSSVVTDPILTRGDWQTNYDPTTIRAYRWEDRYVGFHDDSGAYGGFILDPRGGENAFTRLGQGFIAGFNDLKEDVLYVVNALGTLEKFAYDDLNYVTANWSSKHFFTAKPINLGVCQVSFGEQVGGGNFTVTIKGGTSLPNTTIATEVISDSNYIYTFRLPSGTKYNVFEISLSGAREVSQVIVAESPQELR